jgi:hypothetical protein
MNEKIEAENLVLENRFCGNSLRIIAQLCTSVMWFIFTLQKNMSFTITLIQAFKSVWGYIMLLDKILTRVSRLGHMDINICCFQSHAAAKLLHVRGTTEFASHMCRGMFWGGNPAMLMQPLNPALNPNGPISYHKIYKGADTVTTHLDLQNVTLIIISN